MPAAMPRRTLLTVSLLAAAGVPAAPAPPARRLQGPATGEITGTVVLSHTITTRRPRIRLYSDFGPGQVPPARTNAPNELLNVVVYIDSAPASPRPAADTGPAPAIRQQNEAFVPHVLVVRVGTRVQFPNEDPFFHNVFSLSEAKSFDLGRYPKGQSKAVVFDRPGIVQVFCHIHSDMSAVVLVRPNPYFAVPDSTGRFHLSGVPAGTYRLVGWHERADPVVHEVRVVAGATVHVDFNIPITEAPARGRD